MGKVKVDNEFVCCHNDLGSWNFVVDKDSKMILQVTGWGKASSNIRDYNTNYIDLELEDVIYEELEYEDDENKELFFDLEECLIAVEELPITKEDTKEIMDDLEDILADA